MKILKLTIAPIKGFKIPEALGLLVFLILLWPLAARLVENGDPISGYIDRSIWLLILLSLIGFMLVVGLSWWVLQKVWYSLGLPNVNCLVFHFKTLELWQQLGFFWASFALLLLAAVGSLIAIC